MHCHSAGRERLAPAKLLVTTRRHILGVVQFSPLLLHPGEDILRGMAQMAGMRLAGAWISCVQC